MRILNYRKGGEPFWNMLTIAPMADVDGTSRFFIGVQVRSCLSRFSAQPVYKGRIAHPAGVLAGVPVHAEHTSR